MLWPAWFDPACLSNILIYLGLCFPMADHLSAITCKHLEFLSLLSTECIASILASSLRYVGGSCHQLVRLLLSDSTLPYGEAIVCAFCSDIWDFSFQYMLSNEQIQTGIWAYTGFNGRRLHSLEARFIPGMCTIVPWSLAMVLLCQGWVGPDYFKCLMFCTLYNHASNLRIRCLFRPINGLYSHKIVALYCIPSL